MVDAVFGTPRYKRKTANFKLARTLKSQAAVLNKPFVRRALDNAKNHNNEKLETIRRRSNAHFRNKTAAETDLKTATRRLATATRRLDATEKALKKEQNDHKETKKEVVLQEKALLALKREKEKELGEVHLKFAWLKAKLTRKAYKEVCRLEGEMSTPPKRMGWAPRG